MAFVALLLAQSWCRKFPIWLHNLSESARHKYRDKEPVDGKGFKITQFHYHGELTMRLSNFRLPAAVVGLALACMPALVVRPALADNVFVERRIGPLTTERSFDDPSVIIRRRVETVTIRRDDAPTHVRRILRMQILRPGYPPENIRREFDREIIRRESAPVIYQQSSW